MKQRITWVLAATLVSGVVLLMSCSSNDDENNASSPVVDNNQPTFSSVMKSVQNDMAAADFHELAPLTRALDEGTVRVDSTGLSKQRLDQILSALRNLVDIFYVNNNEKNTYDKSWEFGNLGKTLLLAVDVHTALQNLEDNKASGDRKYNQSLDIKVNDTLAYKVTGFTEKNTEATSSSSSLTNNVNRKLVIAKNGETVLNIESSHDASAGIDNDNLSFSRVKSGCIDYKNMKFSLNCTRDLNSFANTLIYSRNGVETVNLKLTGENSFSFENMLKRDAVFKGQLEANMMNGLSGVKCDINNLNKFYVEGLRLVGLLVTGGTQDDCQERADVFNGIMVSNLLIFGQDAGTLTVEPILSDSVRQVYRPDIIVQAPSIEDGTKLSMSKVMKMMGMNLESLLGMLFK